MGATDDLRRLLGERGIRWAIASSDYERATWWHCKNGFSATAYEWGDLLLVHTVMNPEQAIEATWGGRTCHLEHVNGIDTCSECGADIDTFRNYCQSCGAKVVE